MATQADLVRDNATQLPAYVAKLERLITEQSTPAGAAAMAPRPADAPFPGNAPAFSALMVIWEAVFRIEEFLHDENADPWDDLAMYPRQRRGGSTGNFMAALDAIPKLAAGRNEDIEAWAGRALERLNNVARAVPDIDEADQWRLIRGRRCPYCRCYTLKVLLDAAGLPTRRVECFSGPRATGERCADANGMRPVATMGIDGLQWADGTIDAAPDLADHG